MKMKDSMDRMEFDQGNLQEEAPRRVQRRKRPELKPIWFAAVAVVLLAVVLMMEKRMGREAMGGGDLKLLALTGLYLGWMGNLLCLLLACVLGICAGLASGRRDAPIPWGPSIAAAAWVTLLTGDRVLQWYLSLFGM